MLSLVIWVGIDQHLSDLLEASLIRVDELELDQIFEVIDLLTVLRDIFSRCFGLILKSFFLVVTYLQKLVQLQLRLRLVHLLR